jgi:hypothetical protein
MFVTCATVCSTSVRYLDLETSKERRKRVMMGKGGRRKGKNKERKIKME